MHAGPRKESASRSLSGRPSVRETQLLLLRKTQGLPEGEKAWVLVTKLWVLMVQRASAAVEEELGSDSLPRLHLPPALPLTTTIQIRATPHCIISSAATAAQFSPPSARHNVCRSYNCGACHTPRRTLTPRVAPRELRATQDNHLFVRNSQLPLDRIRSTVITVAAAQL